MNPKLPAHHRLLLQAIVDPESVLACSVSDWELLLRLARQSKLLGVLAVQLEIRNLLSSIPARAARLLSSCLVEISTLHRQARWELNRINWALEGATIPIIVLKGLAYTFVGLPSASGRYSADLDILIAKENLDEFEKLLLSKGWSHPQMSAYDEHYYRAWSHEIPPLSYAGRYTEIDAHHTIAPITSKLRIDTRQLFVSAITADYANCKILCPVDMALHCAVNLFQNNQLSDDIRDLFDLDEMLGYFSVADPKFWDKLIARANQLGLGVALFYGLQFTRHIFQTPVPVNCENDLNQRPGLLAQWFMQRLVPAALFPMHPDTPSRFARFARLFLFFRSHWIRMPPHLLLVHFANKCYAALIQNGIRAESKA